jgi:hypothetical protein
MWIAGKGVRERARRGFEEPFQRGRTCATGRDVYRVQVDMVYRSSIPTVTRRAAPSGLQAT